MTRHNYEEQVGTALQAPRRTKITGTLGPASIGKIGELIEAGLDVVRLNFSHITNPEDYVPTIKEIREKSLIHNKPVAILGDLSGPKIRCNEFAPEPTIELIDGKNVELHYSNEKGTKNLITTAVKGIVEVLEIGHRVLLDDGNMVIKVVSRQSPQKITCVVVHGGILKSHKGINIPDVRVNIPALTEKDKKDAKFLWDQRIDYVAMSFVQHPQDVQDLIDFFSEQQKRNPLSFEKDADLISNVNPLDYDAAAWRPKIILKIEKPQALKFIDELIHISDGIMVARGDLAVELSFEQVPLAQKEIIRKCNIASKPVITATQMLESMIHNPVPTRAEVSDVANAVFDGTDSVMLSAEMATGDFPVETVRRMADICSVAEGGSPFMHPSRLSKEEVALTEKFKSQVRPFGKAISEAASRASFDAHAKAIIAISASGYIAKLVSKRRPDCPIIGVTANVLAYRQLALFSNVIPKLTKSIAIDVKFGSIAPTTDAVHAIIHEELSKDPLCKVLNLQDGDPIVICAGRWRSHSSLSNIVKLASFLAAT